MANELDSIFTPQAQPALGFSAPAVESELDNFFTAQPLEVTMATEPDDLPVEAEDDEKSLLDHLGLSLFTELTPAAAMAATLGQGSTWQGVGTAVKENWNRTKLGFKAQSQDMLSQAA